MIFQLKLLLNELFNNNDYLIIGSYAAKYWFSDFREPNDFDIVCENRLKRIKKIEFNSDLYKFKKYNTHTYIADPEFLLTLKYSHAFWNIHHNKTISDIILLKRKNVEINQKLFEELVIHWGEIHKTRIISDEILNYKENFSNSQKITLTKKYINNNLCLIGNKFQDMKNKKQYIKNMIFSLPLKQAKFVLDNIEYFLN